MSNRCESGEKVKDLKKAIRMSLFENWGNIWVKQETFKEPDLHGMSLKSMDQLRRGYIKDGDDAINSTTCDVLSIWGLRGKTVIGSFHKEWIFQLVVTYRGNRQGVFASHIKLKLPLSSLDVKIRNFAHLRTRNDVISIWRERDSPTFHGTVFEIPNFFPIQNVPEVYCGIQWAAYEFWKQVEFNFKCLTQIVQ